MKPRDGPAEATPDLKKYAWLAIVTAVLTVLHKGSAWAITGSVGLLSDAAESMVNLVAAIVALVSLTRPTTTTTSATARRSISPPR